MKLKSKLIIIGVIAVLVSSTSVYAFTPLDDGSGFLPTPAISKITVQTSPWAGMDTPVVAEIYNDEVWFVSDGSILFNVTESYP